MRIWLENVYSKNVVRETRRQIHKNMDLSTQRLFYWPFKYSSDVISTHDISPVFQECLVHQDLQDATILIP